MSIHGKHLIAGKYSVAGHVTFSAFDPETEAILDPVFTEATEEEVNMAVGSADRDYYALRSLPNAQKAQFLRDIGKEIIDSGDALVERAMQETGLPRARITGERGRTVNQLNLFADVVEAGHYMDVRIDTADPDRTPLPKPDVRMVNIPLGPVVVFGAGNFPLAFSVAGGDTASALAAGCPVIVKGHPGHPGTSELVAEAIKRSADSNGIPPGVFSLLHGKSTAVGQSLVKHPLVRAVAFTGSHHGGRALYDLASSRPHPIPCFAEMGSVNPVFFLPQRLSEAAEQLAEQYIDSVNLGTGQFCTNPGLIFAREDDGLNRFLDSAIQRVQKVAAGVMLHPGIQEGYFSKLRTIQKLPGVEVLAEGLSGQGCTGQSILLKTHATDYIANPGIQEEVFGPSSLVVVCQDNAELLEAAAVLHGNLTATIQASADELGSFSALVSVLERKVGRLIFNGFPTGVEVCHAMVHGGPYPATTDSRFTSVGTRSIERFLRPVCYQDFPESHLPDALKKNGTSPALRMVNGNYS